MKVLLLNPPDENRIRAEFPSKVMREVLLLPPLGLLYLEAYLHRNTSHPVKILDAPAQNISYARLEQELLREKPDFLGISGHTYNLVDMVKSTDFSKKVNPECLVWWGGPHVSAFPRESIEHPAVDGVVYGEGEITLAHLLDALERKQDLTSVKGIIFRRNGEVIDTGPREVLMDLDSLPFPRRVVLDPKKYYYVPGKEVIATSLISSRGCPYHCTFCSTPGKTFRARSAANVVDEMEECADLGIREIYFVDDTFNVDVGRAIAICQEIVRRKIRVGWNIRARVNLITPELVEHLERAGCTRIHLGVETGTDEGLKVLGKGITVEQIRKVFKYLRGRSLTTVAYFMLGCPNEKTLDDIRRTVEFAKEIDPDYCFFGVLTPYPGTKIYEDGIARGIIDPGQWQDFVHNPAPDFKPSPWTEHLSEAQLYRASELAFRSFYLRAGPILKKFKEVGNIHDLVRKFKAGLRIARL